MRPTAIAVAFFCSIVFCPSDRSLWADCPSGVYNFTAADNQFLDDTMVALQAVLPPAPEEWRMDDPTQKSLRPGPQKAGRMGCRGIEDSPFGTSYNVSYEWVARTNELLKKEDEIRKKMHVIKKTPLAADQQKLAMELGEKDRGLRYQARKFEKTDKGEADRLKAEAAVYRKQYDEIYQAHGTTLKPQLDVLQKELDEVLRERNTLGVELSIAVNSKGEDLRDMTPTTSQAGAASAFTGLNQSGSGAKTTLLVYGGTWKKVTGAQLAVFPTGANVRKVHNVVVTAKGEPEQVELILSKLDAAALKALLGK